MNKILILLLAIIITGGCEYEKERNITLEEHPEWKSYFENENVEGTVVILDIKEQKQWIHNLQRAKTGFLPASTYKIMNSMIGLETGSVSLTDTLKWNGEDVWNSDWKKDHVLKTAFAVSCVPCYQEIARRIGVERMVKYTSDANYGHLMIDSTTIDNFWLVGDSKISAIEQVQFIERLYHEDLPFSKNTMNSVKEIMLNEQTEEYTLRAKTGWSQSETINNGWFVGYLTTSDEKAYAFATNIERTRSVSSDGFAGARKSIAMAIFKELGII